MISYPVMEHFYTLQGEGAYSGKAAYFIRLGGCDVGCTWCDVKESWPIDAHPKMTLEALEANIKATKTQIIVVTGGEPTLHNLEPLTQMCHKNGWRTHIETSGTNPLTGKWDWVCFSPKRFKKPLQEYYKNSDELKIIVAHTNDLRWAETHRSEIDMKTKCFLQVEWEHRESLSPTIIEYIQQNSDWQLSIQTHKYLNIP